MVVYVRIYRTKNPKHTYIVLGSLQYQQPVITAYYGHIMVGLIKNELSVI